MRNQELINAIAIATHTPPAKIAGFMIAYKNAILQTLKTGDVVTHTNFMTYYVGKRTARVGINPRTLQPILIKAAKLVRGRTAHSANDFLN